MVLFGRACTDRPPVLLQKPMYIYYTILIWYIVNCSPKDIVFRLLKSSFFVFIFEIILGIIYTREICHGYLIGLREFPDSYLCPFLIATILSSTESFIWLLFYEENRNFGII